MLKSGEGMKHWTQAAWTAALNGLAGLRTSFLGNEGGDPTASPLHPTDKNASYTLDFDKGTHTKQGLAGFVPGHAPTRLGLQNRGGECRTRL